MAEELHFGRAAERLAIVQSAVSRQVSTAENYAVAGKLIADK